MSIFYKFHCEICRKRKNDIAHKYLIEITLLFRAVTSIPFTIVLRFLLEELGITTYTRLPKAIPAEAGTPRNIKLLH